MAKAHKYKAIVRLAVEPPRCCSSLRPVRLVTRAMASEEDEVRALLMRHRRQIIRDVNESKLVAVLAQKGVLNAANEQHLNDIEAEYRKLYPLNGSSAPIIDTVAGQVIGGIGGGVCEKSAFGANDPDIDEKKCTFLIDVIARHGFEKFKEFCYAIENECPQLIEDLINDRLNGGK